MNSTLEASVEVAVGVLRHPGSGHILLSQRCDGAHMAGYWEFPGGKLETCETAEQALTRELREELGIDAGTVQPLIRHRYHYPADDGHAARQVLLHAFEVRTWAGDVSGGEGQVLKWVAPGAIDPSTMPAANGPLLAAARLPHIYAIHGNCDGDHTAFLERMDSLVTRGVRLACLRCPGLPPARYRALAIAALDRVRLTDFSLLLHGDIDLALSLAAAGVHLPARALKQFTSRPLPPDQWLAASCHDAEELEQAARIGCDFAVLSPVAATSSHPQQTPLGWARFEELAQAAGLPVFALGGMRGEDLDSARARGAQGVALHGALWH
ncbi:MAG: Nudix family hydrolase [Immundisolibacter sp.]|uniref:Nudix family hydrolase n=1 Tax=Immundisolibacter sp. TaxID=1934948 RepID=UPI003EE334D6